MAYDYIHQSILATTVISAKNNDSFFAPTTLAHTGYAWDGNLYINGVLQTDANSPGWGDLGWGDEPYGGLASQGLPRTSSWVGEAASDFRGSGSSFPTNCLILVSEVSLTIIDQSTGVLNQWMTFLLADAFALTNNFLEQNQGWIPFILQYASGVVTVGCKPDLGANPTTRFMAINLDFSQDSIYLDTAIGNPNGLGDGGFGDGGFGGS